MKNIFIAVIFLIAISVIPAKSQDDSTNSPITKKLGVIIYPLEGKIGLRYCFGKKGRMIIEDDVKPRFLGASKTYMNDHLGFYTKINELKFMFAWKSSNIIKLYSGVALDYGYYNKPYSDYLLCGSYIPLGMELFPSTRFPGLNVILESNYKTWSELNFKPSSSFTVRVGVGCYF